MTEYNKKIEEQIKLSLDYLDEKIEVKTPGLGKFRQMVEQAELQKRKKSNRQFLIFIITAFAAVCIETFGFNRSLYVFLAINAAAIIAFPIAAIAISKRHRKVNFE